MTNSVRLYNGEQSATKLEAFTDGNMVQNELTADSTDNILACLNGDCIMHVFEYLPLCDLCNVAGVCRVFKSNALSVFKRRHSDLDLDELLDERDYDDISGWSDRDFDDISGWSDSDDESKSSDRVKAWNSKHMRYKPPVKERRVRRFDMDTVINLFLHFGAYIKTIDLAVNDKDQKDEILELMAIFCTHKDAQLTKLILNDITIEPDLIPRIQCLFDRLKFLDLVNGSIYALPNCPELTELTVQGVYLTGTFRRQFEKLHTLTILDVLEGSPGCVQSLLLMPTQLKRLNIAGFSRLDINLLPLQLEELEFDWDIPNILNFTKLRNLKVLTLHYIDLLTTDLFNNLVEQNVPIEELCLTNFELAVQTATSLAGLNKIRKLWLVDGKWPNNVKLSTVVKGMPLLEKLCLSKIGRIDIDVIKSTIENAPKLKKFVVNDDCDERQKEFIIGTNDYNEICQLSRRRLETTKLTLELKGIHIKLDVPENIIETNRFWLDLKLPVTAFGAVQPVNIITYYGFSEDSESSDDSD